MDAGERRTSDDADQLEGEEARQDLEDWTTSYLYAHAVYRHRKLLCLVPRCSCSEHFLAIFVQR